MQLQFIIGGSGAGKSEYIYKQIIQESMKNPNTNYLIMVPDQFTMYTQKQLCQMHPNGGIMNIDVQSFARLIHRLADEVGQKQRPVLDDTGKNLILRKVALMRSDDLLILKNKMKRPGYVHEVKSVISEFYQYDISTQDIDEMIKEAEGKGQLQCKLKDLKLLYKEFETYIKDKYITTEEALERLCEMIYRSHSLKDSVVVFDGFTGFTPVQYNVIDALMNVCQKMYVTVCADSEEDFTNQENLQGVFSLSSQTYWKFIKMAENNHALIQSNIQFTKKPVYRLKDNKAISFLEENIFRYHDITFSETQDRICLYQAESLVCEVQGMCMKIKQLLMENKYAFRDIAVVTGDLERYAHIMENEFDRYDIPYYMDRNRSVDANALAEYMRSALTLVAKNFSFESVFRFLRCGLTGLTLDEIDRFEIYVRAHGIKGKRKYERMFIWGDEAPSMNEIRCKLMDELSPVLKKKATASEYCVALFELCSVNNLQAKCRTFAEKFKEKNDTAKAKEYEKIYPACMDLINQIYELIGDDKVSLDEFIQIFEAGISEIKIGTIPQKVDQLLVGDIERTRLNEIKVLFILGVNDGVIPGKGAKGGILSDLEREFFMNKGHVLSPTPRQKIFEQRLYLYQNMTKARDYLFVSYSLLDGAGKTVLPSYLIGMLKDLFPGIKLQSWDTKKDDRFLMITGPKDGYDDLAADLREYINCEKGYAKDDNVKLMEDILVLATAYSKQENMPKAAEKIVEASLYSYIPKPLSETTAALLYRKNAKESITRLEKFAACSYAQFLQYGLMLREQMEYSFDSIDFGSVYHFVLEEFFKKLSEEKIGLTDIDKQEIENRVSDILKAYSKEYADAILYSSARDEYRISQMRKVLVRSICTIQYHFSKSSFLPELFEYSFKMPGDMELVGKIDRVDTCREKNQIYAKIMDYKSGHKEFNADEIFYGLSLQLPIYMQAAMLELSKRNPECEVIPASMLYFGLANPMIAEKDLKKDQDVEDAILLKMKCDGVTVAEDEVISKLDTGFNSASTVLKISKKKDDSFTSNSQVISTQEFKLILDYTDKIAKDMMKSIQKGKIDINPVQLEGADRDSCSYCSFKGICGFDGRIDGYEKKELPLLSDEERKEKMENAIHEGSGKSNNNQG